MMSNREHGSRILVTTAWVRRIAFAGTAALAGSIATIAPAMAAGASADLAINHAYVAGGATRAEAGHSLTFDFGAKNFGPSIADVSIDLVTSRGLTGKTLECVLRNGSVINPDDPNCETGTAKAGQSGGHLVLTGTVSGTSNVTVTACVESLNGTVDPHSANNCRTLRVQLL
jgi:Domain of unknown function DUF11